MFKNCFSFNGRIRRLEFVLSYIINFLFIFGTDILLWEFGNPKDLAINIMTIILFIPAGWFITAQSAKRCHDLGESGWWQLNPFYLLYLFFKRGQPESNKYDENPKESKVNHDPFLTIPISNGLNDKS